MVMKITKERKIRKMAMLNFCLILLAYVFIIIPIMHKAYKK